MLLGCVAIAAYPYIFFFVIISRPYMTGNKHQKLMGVFIMRKNATVVTCDMLLRNIDKPVLKVKKLRFIVWYPTYLAICFGEGMGLRELWDSGKISDEEFVVKGADFTYNMYKVMCC